MASTILAIAPSFRFHISTAPMSATVATIETTMRTVMCGQRETKNLSLCFSRSWIRSRSPAAGSRPRSCRPVCNNFQQNNTWGGAANYTECDWQTTGNGGICGYWQKHGGPPNITKPAGW